VLDEKKGSIHMRIAVITLILSLGAVIVLALSDDLNIWLVGGPLVLLLSIPVALTLFTFLSHHEQEQRQEELTALKSFSEEQR
jgi:ABC-type nickel/cobalt efflux system permease component RcnA